MTFTLKLNLIMYRKKTEKVDLIITMEKKYSHLSIFYHMKNYFIISLILLVNQLAFGQQESFGEFSYYENIEGQKVTSTSMPYKSGNSWMTVKLKSGYAFTININKRDSILQILELCTQSNVTERTIIGKFKPSEVFKTVESSEESILAPVEMSFYYDGKKVMISFPELYDKINEFLGKPHKAPGHTFYILKEDLDDFINCFKVDLIE